MYCSNAKPREEIIETERIAMLDKSLAKKTVPRSSMLFRLPSGITIVE